MCLYFCLLVFIILLYYNLLLLFIYLLFIAITYSLSCFWKRAETQAKEVPHASRSTNAPQKCCNGCKQRSAIHRSRPEIPKKTLQGGAAWEMSSSESLACFMAIDLLIRSNASFLEVRDHMGCLRAAAVSEIHPVAGVEAVMGRKAGGQVGEAGGDTCNSPLQ